VAIGDPYVGVVDLEDKFGKPDDGTYADIAEAASRAIELFTGRQFNRAATASPRRFRAVDRRRLATDDFWTVQDLAVEVSGVAWDVDQVDPRPWDGIVSGQPGWPFFDLFAVDRSWPARTLGRRALVTVTARWGWEAVPEGIRQAVLDVASDPGVAAVVTSEAAGGLSVAYGTLNVDPSQLMGIVSGNPAAFMRAAPYVRTSPLGIG
jgi:hypothetical protein